MRLGRTVVCRAPLRFVDLVLIGNLIYSTRVLHPPGPDACLTHEADRSAAALAAGEIWDRRVADRTLYQVVPGLPGTELPSPGYPWLLHLRLPDGALHSLHLLIPQGTPWDHQAQLAADFLRQSIAIAQLVPDLPARMKRWNSRTVRALCESAPLAAVVPLGTGPQEVLSDSADFSAYLSAAVLQSAAATGFDLQCRATLSQPSSRARE